MAIEKETEEKIFAAAQEVFQKKGFDGARMQEIADEAEINKSMLHYYYRSKDKLFMAVFQVGIKKILPKVLGVLGSDKNLEEKVVQIVDFYYYIFSVNPHLPAFVIHEMNMHPERFRDFILSTEIQIPQEFKDQVEDEVAAGRMVQIKPEQFLINIVSMCMMPVIAKKLVQVIFSFDESDYKEFLKERRTLIPELIMNGVKPT
ncbi:MAG: TetR/AcrR family transcriptional regulator [Balneolaceae bacterium]